VIEDCQGLGSKEQAWLRIARGWEAKSKLEIRTMCAKKFEATRHCMQGTLMCKKHIGNFHMKF
jgi:hypothetical protein